MFEREFEDEFFNEDVSGLVEQYERQRNSKESCFFEESSFEQLIEYYEDNNQLERASEVADIAIVQYPFSAGFMVKKAQLLFDFKQFHLAIDLLDKAAILDPGDINIYLLQADIYMWLHDFKKAISTIEDFMQTASTQDLPDLYLELADIYEEREMYDEVFENLNKSLELEPENEEALNRMWFCVEFTERYEESILLHTKLIDDKPYSYLAWFNLAHAYSGIGLFEKAIEAFEFALAINEDYEYAYKDAADIYFKMKRYEKAAEYYLKAAEISKPYKELFVCAGECYYKMKDFVRARQYFRKATGIDPYFDIAFYKMGLSYQAEGRISNAVGSFERAHKLNPKTNEYMLALANAYYLGEQLEKSVVMYKKALAGKQVKKAGWINAAKAMFEALDYRNAIDTLDDAIEVFDRNAEFYYAKSAIYYQIGNRKEAMLQLETGLLKEWKKHKLLFNITPYMKNDPCIIDLIEQYKK